MVSRPASFSPGAGSPAKGGLATPVRAFMPVEITPVPAQATPVASPARRTGLIEIVLRHGRRIRVDREVDAEALRRVLQVMESLA